MDERQKRERITNTSQRYSDSAGRYSRNEIDDTKSYLETKYTSSWITVDATPQMVEYAEKAGKYMADKKLTKSKIRSIYGEIKRIQIGGYDKEKSSFYLLKPKVAYAYGRDKDNQGLEMFKYIFDKCFADVSNQKTYQNFCNFIEAILAYHKAFGGGD